MLYDFTSKTLVTDAIGVLHSRDYDLDNRC